MLAPKHRLLRLLNRLQVYKELTWMGVQAASGSRQQALQLEDVAKRAKPVSDSDIIRLNVGGTLLSTKRSTLTQACCVYTLDYAATLHHIVICGI